MMTFKDDLPRGLVEVPESGVRRVAVIGGSGRLGSTLIRHLTQVGCSVHVFDARPPEPLPGVEFTACDLGRRGAFPPDALAGVDAVVHLGSLHGPHLKVVPRHRFWAVNVHGTEQLFEAAVRTGVRRIVLASSTSVYGSGSPAGSAAKVLDEDSPLDPEDVYDLTKIAAERLLEQTGVGVALRFGRFFFPSHAGYHLRKLSTGLDVRDACQAVALALTNEQTRRFYCIASDLPLSVPDRQRMGFSVPEVMEEALPGLGELAAKYRTCLPERVGKSVNTAVARAELDYRPERALDWVARLWAAEAPRSRLPLRFRGAPDTPSIMS